MEDWSKPQNESFSKIFDALKRKANPTYKGDALTLLHLNDENFIKLYRDTTEITGEDEDIELCRARALFLNCH
jgi:hypothetical protein